MKILWFANTPCGAREKLDPNTYDGGWLSSLESALVEKTNIDVSIAFYWGEKLAPFKYKNTMYYPIFRKRSGSKFGRLVSRLENKTKNVFEIDQMLQIVQQVNPDVIHIHGTEDNFGLIQEFICKPTVISIQGLLSPYLEKYFSGISKFDAFLYEGVVAKALFNSASVYYNIMNKRGGQERIILSMSNYILGRTDWDRRITRVLSPKSKYFVGNEMLRTLFYSNNWSKKRVANEPFRIITTMTGGLYKGLESIVKTAQILCENDSIKFEWIVIGQTEADSLAKIVKRWLKVDFKSLNIHLVGLKSEQELVDSLSKADIYCQVSHIENSPNSVCEAMLLGMPIVATYAGGTDSIVENKKEGLLVQDGDPYSIAGAILELFFDYEKSLYLANNARAKAKERHSKDLIVNNLIHTYEIINGTNLFIS